MTNQTLHNNGESKITQNGNQFVHISPDISTLIYVAELLFKDELIQDLAPTVMNQSL